MQMHIFRIAFQSNELENETLSKWHIHTCVNSVERPKQKKIKTTQKPPQNLPKTKTTPKVTPVV